jgi:DNA mismatch endonuclease, patch repair protein
MSAIRSSENRTESALRRALHARGLRYRKYSPALPGKPDVVFSRERIAVFVDGDYWHGRLLRERGVEALRSYYTERQQQYWLPKLARNVARDDYVTGILEAQGWMVLRFWESDLKKDVATAVNAVTAALKSRREKGKKKCRPRSGAGG